MNYCAHIWLDTADVIGVKRGGMYHHLYPLVCKRCKALRTRGGKVIDAPQEPIEHYDHRHEEDSNEIDY